MDEILLSTLRLSIPLILAAYAGLMSERSGVANIGLEAYLLVSAFASAAVASATGSWELGVFAGILGSLSMGIVFGVACIWGRGDQIVIGTAMNLLAAGIIPVVNRAAFSVTGSTPTLPIENRFSHPEYFFVICLLLVVILELLFRKTKHGLRITAAGNAPFALLTQGVSVKAVRLRAILEGAAIAGVGGTYLSMCQGSGYVRNMSAGRGFLALAALIFGSWKPFPTLLACLFFALTDALQMQMQGIQVSGHSVPNQFVQIFPFVVTLLVLIVFSGRIRSPRAINQDVLE